MAKKEIKSDKYTKEDLEKLLKLFRHVGPLYQEQQDLIYEMLRKYIDANHPRPIANCNCQLSYGAAFNTLRDYTMANSDKFIY